MWRMPYVTIPEFPEWAATIVELARNGADMTVEEWRAAHPLEDESDPYDLEPSANE